MSLLSLENIIQKSYYGIMNGELLKYCDTLSKLAGIILADIYETYENNKNNNTVTELKFFLHIRDPIKHIISILNKFRSGAISIKHAIIDEIRIIKNHEHFVMKKYTLLDVIEEELVIFKNDSHRLRNPEVIAQSIIDKLTGYRIEGYLHQDAESFLMMSEIKNTLVDIINRTFEGEDVKDILLIYYKALDAKKRIANSQLDETLARLKIEMLQLIQCEFDEVHTHLGSMGEQLYNVASGNIETEIDHKHPSPKLNDDKNHMIPRTRDIRM